MEEAKWVIMVIRPGEYDIITLLKEGGELNLSLIKGRLLHGVEVVPILHQHVLATRR